MTSKLALYGGPKTVNSPPGNVFKWPIITEEHEQAVLAVLRRGAMSGTDVTKQYEEEFAAWQGSNYAVGCNTGTAALFSAFFGCKIGVGDEVICPSLTYWASALPLLNLGATPVFAEPDPHSLCLDPADIEHRITDRTKAIVVVHCSGHPADMDPIMAIAKRHNLKVIEDVSHAQGGLYKGRRLGTIGDVAAMSLMSTKSFATGEAGIVVTDDREIYERVLAFGHYERFTADNIETENLKPYVGLPLGGQKLRMHQLSSAMGRVQLKYYDGQTARIREAMHYFWDLLADTPGLQAHRIAKDQGSTMAGWFGAVGIYRPEELSGLSLAGFSQAVRAEGSFCHQSWYRPLHVHPVFNTADIYNHGTPTRIANVSRDLRQPQGSLPRAEELAGRIFLIPWFKYLDPIVIEEQAAAFRKVAANHKELLKEDPGNPQNPGGWSTSGVAT